MGHASKVSHHCILVVGSKLADFSRAVHRYSPAFDVFIQPQPFLAAVALGTCRFILSGTANAQLVNISPGLTSSVLLRVSAYAQSNYLVRIVSYEALVSGIEWKNFLLGVFTLYIQ